MYKHQEGDGRTFRHNLEIASVLSFVAGIVNATGFLNLGILTTNVTGHFALFINDLDKLKLWQGMIYFLYIFSFLGGSFFSSFLIERAKLKHRNNVYSIPVVIECVLLITIAVLVQYNVIQQPHIIACLLLFAMGHQNSFVTKISNAIVRTTHLTGLFTDLGIELSQLLLNKRQQNNVTVKKTIKLRLYIISFFLLGGLLGGYISTRLAWHMNTLILAAVLLGLSMLYSEARAGMVSNKKD